MASITSTHIYLPIRKPEERSHLEDELVLDGAKVSSFASARDLWELVQVRPARFVITDRKFGDGFDGLALLRKMRGNHPLPHVYVLMRSLMSQINDIREGLDLGVDDYLVLSNNPFQIHSRGLVGMRWITYIDSIVGSSKTRTSAAA
jgi:DNA-binding response OmpR family regulator